MEVNNNKNSIVITVIAVATLLVAVVGATFAYFQATADSAKSTNVTVTTGTAGSTTFTVGSAINITADQTTFASGAGNRSGSTTGSAKFVAPTAVSGTLNASDLQSCYKVTVNISANGFSYTVNSNTPELTLTVTKNSTAVVSSKDITTTTGDIQIPTASGGTTYTHTLSTTAGGNVTDSWNVTVTLINLTTNQNANAGKSLSGTLKFESTSC